ncbi:hypothetical protein MG293_001692 [Ovis ammon polii]|uniref:VWFA domain-containing protein n=1 Tax=Ovis ammon polii TaxID=230172 RepID=A0AAD4UMR9_OVIAM|nr:hypothetical protein MG293_001692 [Ovis ammon polii]
MVNLINNGYDGIVIAINPSVPEDEKLIENIKADVIVANPYLKYGDDPYTLQYGRCGEKGKYIHFTPNFLLTNSSHIYGSRENNKSGMIHNHQSDQLKNNNTIIQVPKLMFDLKYLVKCMKLRREEQAIIHSNESTSGSEIILLTDGEDKEINLCFEDVKQSGAIIHTIALGPSAAKELETLSNMTGGYRFFANKDINGLTNAFSRISSRSGSITQQAIQLESKALNITGRKRVNGTVPVDSTIGNDTFFVVTWTIKKPEIVLQDPKGKKYKTSDFKEDKLNIRSARLRIPGIAETGTWTYSLLNNHASSQMLTVTVTTRARSPTTPPVTATAHMSQHTAHYPSPVIVYAQVSQGFLPVLGISVIAIIETEDGRQVTLELWDNGAGKIILNPPRPEVRDDLAKAKIEDFSRLTYGESFIVSGAPTGNHPSVLPPNKITDLEAKFKADYIQLSWTAPGNVLDKGKPNRYVIRISKSFMDLQEDFDNATLVNTSNLIPKEAGSKENFEFKPEHFRVENGTKFYIAVQAINEANLISEVSHIVQAIKFIPLPEDSVHALGTKISAISLAIFGLPMIFSIF